MSKFKFNKTLAAGAVSLALAGLSTFPTMAADNASKGFLQGIAKSETGSVASGVSITIKNKSTGLTRTVTTDSDGQYKFPLLPAGSYSLITSSGAFEPLSEDVNISVGGKTLINLTMTDLGNTVTVVGTAISALDTTSSEQSYVFSDDDIKRMPVGRNLTGVALLAPGVIQGDNAFGNLPSFGGSSVAENIYMVNGLNITSHRDGLAFTNVPFEFFETFNVKTGGWSAEFGRALGGAIISNTKSGSNEFEMGASAYFIPDDFSAHSSNVDSNDDSGFWLNTENDTVDTVNYNFWAGGALIEDKLFAFGLLNPRTVKSTNIGNTTYSNTDRVDLFYGLKLDYYITDDHIVELTAFGDDRNYDVDTGTITDNIQTAVGPYVREVGGNNFILQYTGVVNDDVTVSAMYGLNKYKNSSFADGVFNLPCAFERTTGENLSGYVLCTNVNQEDEREQFRFDVDWYVGDHTLRFGIDAQNLTANENTVRSGGNVFRYDTDYYGPGDSRVRIGVYDNSGGFETKDSALYFEDTWEVTDDLVLKLGIRNDSFANYNLDGDKFIDTKNQVAPRIGVTWDPIGNGEDKVFGTFGRYYLGVATNTNVRLAGAELFTRQYCHTDGPDATGTPTNVNTCAGTTVYGDGQLRSTAETVDASIEPMYEDEMIFGYAKELADNWTVGFKWTYRELGESIEDIAIDAGFTSFLADQGETCTNCSGFHYYVLTNPGSGETTITTDPNGGTNPQTYTIPNSYLGYPKAERYYKAWDFDFGHKWDGNYMFNLTYTWSHSTGNNEGWVRSDNGQTDAGLTTNFDQPGLTDFGYGDLPNDRRHQVKMQGAYAITDELTVGVNASYITGRPFGAFGIHPTDDFASLYGAASFFASDEDGNTIAVPRGSLGRLPDLWKVDMNVNYTTEMAGHEVSVTLDLFNIFDNDSVTERNEVHDQVGGFRFDGSYGFAYTGVKEPNFGLPTGFQTPRYARLSASWKF